MNRSRQEVALGVALLPSRQTSVMRTDTGGSVRLPAAYTGMVGFKPSYGRISRWGVVAYANSLDTVGILARKTSVIRDVFVILNQHDDRDPTSLSPCSRSRIASYFASPSLSNRLVSRPLRVGVPIEYNISELTSSVRHVWLNALSHLEELGHTIHPVSLPATKLALSAYYVLAPAEASSNLAKYDGVRYGTRAEGKDRGDGPDGYLYARTRGQGFGAEVKRRILLGSFSLSADAMDNYFIQAQKVRRLVQADFDAIFDAQNLLLAASSLQVGLQDLGCQGGQKQTSPTVDVLIAPTAPSIPPRLSSLVDKTDSLSSLRAYLNDVFTVPASLAGLPAISIPVRGTGAISNKQENNLEASEIDNVGLQIIGQFGDDELVLKVGETLENQKVY